MRILFQVTTTPMLRHFWDVIRLLASRGHAVRIAAPDHRPDLPPPAALLGHKRITFVTCPGTRGDALGSRIYELRALRDYLRYFEPPLVEAPKLRGRALGKLVKAMSGEDRSHLRANCPKCGGTLVDDEITRLAIGCDGHGRARLDSLLALVEATIPSDKSIEAFLREERPDVLLVTPLIKIGSHQHDYVKSAKALGIPVGFPVFSWDNLSSKGLVHELPDLTLVWNDWQKREAIEMHRVPADRIVVTGAPRFDAFFAMKPRWSRERFCRRHKLDPQAPIITYLCSSAFVAKHEREFVTRWIAEVRQDPALAPCNIVIRPHPREKGQWKKFAAPYTGVAVSMPGSISYDQLLFDTAYHSAAVVGLNTSAQLEAGIVGRPVLTVLAPDDAPGQQGSVHFQYLLRANGGFVEVAPDFETHRRHLRAALAGEYDPAVIRGFVERFLRPHGLNRRVTPIMVDVIEGLARPRGARRLELTAEHTWWRVRAPVASIARRARRRLRRDSPATQINPKA